MSKYSIAGLIGVLFYCLGCLEISKPFSELPPGKWRGELILEDDPQSNKNDLVLPFNFTITYDDKNSMIMTIMNAQEEITVRDITFGTNRESGSDTVRIDFPVFDTHISAEYREDVLEGFWYVHYRDNYKIPFVAYHGEDQRFEKAEVADHDLSGNWNVRMEIETDTEYSAIGQFKQNGNKLTGTFLTETGDYRYLEGVVSGDELFLSCFDGSHAFYFDGAILESGNILGRFYSGIHYKTNWTGVRSEESSLISPFELSKAVSPEKPVDFSFPNTTGQMIGPNSEKFAGKPKIVRIMGTWCPNCMDETNFILNYLEENPQNKIDVIDIAFERYRNKAKALEAIARYKKVKEIPYEVLYGGYYDKKEASKTLQVLEEIKSYPTLIFLDENNRIVKIHTGFSGPATSEYERFVEDFNEIVKELLES